MPRYCQRWLSLAVLLLTTATTGCIAGFHHTLSDEKTSVVDERLLGEWQLVYEDPPHAEDRIWTVTVHRMEGANSLELVVVEGKDRIEHNEVLYTVKLGDQWYGSMVVTSDEDEDEEDALDDFPGVEEDEDTEPEYYIFAYQIEKGNVRLYPLDEDVLAAGIKSGKLTGRARRRKPGHDPSGAVVRVILSRVVLDLDWGVKSKSRKYDVLELSDTPANLRKFLSTQEKTYIEIEDETLKSFVFKRPPKKP